MVSILPNQRSPFDLIGSAIGQNLQQVLPGAVQQGYNRGQLQNNLSQLSGLAKSGASPLDITLSAMQAGAGIPGSERYLGQIIPMLQQLASANASQNAPLAGEANIQRMQERQQNPVEPMPQRQQLPNFANGVKQQTAQTFPTNIGPQGGPGNIPQASTAGEKVPLFKPSELIPQAKELAAQRTKAGIPTTAKEALEELKEVEKEKKSYNEQVDRELSQRVEGQKTYGERAVDYLRKVDPQAGSEVEAIFQKKGEEIAKNGGSEADINRALAKEAEKYKIAIENVNEDLSSPRIQNAIQRGVNGTYKNFNESAEDLRKNMKPLIDMGLYNKGRELLQSKGYGPEEREIVLHPLSDQGLSFIRQTPDVKPRVGVGRFGVQIPRSDLNNIKESLKKVKEVDPNFSPILARKAFEDLNYGWRDFKDAWNSLLNEGFELTDDQQQMQGFLDRPPINTIDRFLSDLNLIGR